MSTTTTPTNLAGLVADARDALPEMPLLTDPIDRESYRHDETAYLDAGLPGAVALPRTTDEVSTLLRLATAHRVSVVPRGAGTGLSGGAAGIEGALTIALTRMDQIFEIDGANLCVITQPGVINATLKAAVAAAGFFYAPDPASYESCSIGGNLGTNAGGLCCVKYGVTSDYVLGMTVVLADGTAVILGGPRLKDVAGLSLTKMFVGSEGTLGIITEITLRLIPAQRPPATLVATFASLVDATQTVLDITREMRPSMLEFMDSTCINAVEDLTKMGLDRHAAGMLIVQSDEPTEYAAQEIARITAICENNNATEVYATNDPVESEAFVVARRMAIPAVEKTGTILLEDVGVPIPLLGELVLGMERISRKNDVTIAVLAHAGDGNTHPLIVFDPADDAQRERSHIAYGEIMDLAIGLGGTITGEHGIGRLKKPWLPDYLGEDVMALNLRIKSALDPDNIFNPGSVF